MILSNLGDVDASLFYHFVSTPLLSLFKVRYKYTCS